MKISRVFLGVALALGLSGCFSVDKVTIKSTGEEHVVMHTYGWKLFNWVPLFSGNADEDSTSGVALFRDDVKLEKVQKRFVAYAAGRKIECPMYDLNDTVVWYVFGIPIPYVFTYKEITLSGTMK